jgi:hypothetical protein
MRTSFELEFESTDYDDARAAALSRIGEFLKIDSLDVEDKVSVELKVKEHPENTTFLVTAHGQVKNNGIHTPKS